MIPCICIDATNKPNDIPNNKWLKKNQEYHVIYTITVLPQKQLAFHLAEIELDETCYPYQYFLANRFAFTEENLLLLMELIKDCSDTDFSMDELIKQTEIINQ
tara:strand:- start:176 stop:484 length:309 start_codon:yes stop_codon:yes gene_type:complete